MAGNPRIIIQNNTGNPNIGLCIYEDNDPKEVVFGEPFELKGHNPPGTIVVSAGGQPVTCNLVDSDPPQPPFTDGVWLFNSSQFFSKDQANIWYSNIPG